MPTCFHKKTTMPTSRFGDASTRISEQVRHLVLQETLSLDNSGPICIQFRITLPYGVCQQLFCLICCVGNSFRPFLNQ